MSLPHPETCQVEREGVLYTINLADLGEDEVPYLAPVLEDEAALAVVDGEAPAEGWAALTVKELAAECSRRSLAVASGARKVDLVALLESLDVPAAEPEPEPEPEPAPDAEPEA